MRHPIFVPLLSDPTSLVQIDATPAGDGQFRLVGEVHHFDHITIGEISLTELF